MSDLPGMPSSIRCDACGFENPTTSLYCQDCGARLVAQPSALAKEPVVPAATQASFEKRKPRILSVERHNRIGPFVFVTLRTLIVAAVAALIIVILLPPVGAPPVAAPLPLGVIENVRSALQRSALLGQPFVAPWDGDGLNAYLAGVLQAKKTPSRYGIEFVSAQLAPLSGGFALYADRKVIGLTLHTRVSYRFVARGSGMGLVPAQVSIGRLTLPAAATPLGEYMNLDVAVALARELSILREAKSVQCTREKAYVDFRATRP